MHRKNIRQLVTKQLKYNHPHWKKMTKKSKKELAKQVMDEVVSNYDYSQILDLPIKRLTGTEDQTPSEGIRILAEMAEYIDNFYSDNLFNFDKIRKPYPEISYRKFCTDEYFGKERKQNRRFIKLPLNTKKQVHHTELSHFRASFSFTKLMNILVYILHHVIKDLIPPRNSVSGPEQVLFFLS